MPIVYCQLWQCTETGNGPDFRRPDGYSYHEKEEDIPTFVREIRENGGHSWILGSPYPVTVSTDEWAVVHKAGNGVRRHGKAPKQPS